MSCPPPVPDPCAPVCPPPPPPPPCLVKPIMRGLHIAQTKKLLVQALIFAGVAGMTYRTLVGQPRIELYKHFYKVSEFDDWADEMARKGLFQSVPQESLKDNQHVKKK